jgi:hypothetical protein
MNGEAVEVVRRRLVELLDLEHGWELVADSLIGTGRVGGTAVNSRTMPPEPT